MAFIAFKVSRTARKVLYWVGIILCFLQTIFGTVIAAVSLAGVATISSKMHDADEAMLNKVFFSLAAFGMSLKVHNVYGLKLYMDCKSLSLHYRTRRKWCYWLIATWFLSVFTLLVACISKPCAENLILQLEHNMHEGMAQYLNDQHWKETWNNLQQDLKCCGVDDHEDWYTSSWIHSEHLLNDEKTVSRFTETDGRTLPPAIPWSCCNPHSQKPCVHDNLHQKFIIDAWANDQTVILSTIFTVGCIKNIKLALGKGAKVVCGMCVSSFLVQVASTFIFQYLYTSALSAILMGDLDGSGFGWIFGRGDFGWKKGPTLGEINLAWEQKLLLKDSAQKGGGGGEEEQQLLADVANIPTRRRKSKRKKRHRIPETMFE